jgi:hypothetical protein
MTKTHALNVYPLRFALIADEFLKFVLMNRMLYADRIEAGDQLNLCEYRTHGAGLTGRTIKCRITHVISGLEMPELPEDIVAVSLEVIAEKLPDTVNTILMDSQEEGEEKP